MFVPTELVNRIRQASELEVQFALQAVTTLEGAERIWAAEFAGRRRDKVLRAADARIAEFDSGYKPSTIMSVDTLKRFA